LVDTVAYYLSVLFLDGRACWRREMVAICLFRMRMKFIKVLTF